jgi:hypothetical protein
MIAEVSTNVSLFLSPRLIPFLDKFLCYGTVTFLKMATSFLAEFRPAAAPLTDKLPRKCPPVTATAAFVHAKRSLSSLAVESGSRISHGLQQDRILSKESEQKSEKEDSTTGKLVNNNPQRLYR